MNELATIDQPTLTRDELFDLIIDEMENELEAQLDSLKAQLEKVPTLTIRDVADITAIGEMELGLAHRNKDQWRISFEDTYATVKKKDLPAGFISAREHNEKVNEKIRKVEQIQNKLVGNTKKAKLQLLRSYLADTESGKALLKKLDEYRSDVKKRILGVKEAKALNG